MTFSLCSKGDAVTDLQHETRAARRTLVCWNYAGEVIVDPGLSLCIVWMDADVVELSVHASNGRFSGEVRLYAGHDVLDLLAGTLRSFPTSNQDHREIELGAFEPRCAGGGLRLRLRCIDGAGHAVLDVTLRSDADQAGGRSETADFSMPVEAAALDQFVTRLETGRVAVGSAAALISVATSRALG